MKRLPRIYGILDLETCQSRSIDPVFLARYWCDIGIRLIQLRSKSANTRDTFRFCSDIAIAIAGYPNVLLLVNDRIDICLALGLAGVHLPSNGLTINTTRTILPDATVSTSCHSDEEIRTANRDGADFVTLSPILQPNSKPEDTRPALGLDALKTLHTIPVFALGGMDAESGARAIDHGAYGVAMLGALTTTEIEPSLIQFIQGIRSD